MPDTASSGMNKSAVALQGATATSSSSSSSALKKFERPGLMVDEIEEMKEAFDLFDLDGSGRVAPKDLCQAIQNLGLEHKNTVVQQILKDLEKCSHTIEFQDFLDLFSAKMGERDTREDIAKVFRLFDDDHTGYLTVKNLARVAKELGEALTENELNEMVLRADSSHSGKVSLDDFYSLMVHRSFP
ncbi:unnamed protein product [Amoebophrya sp. A120]|nr:unnamed protein product [Amoebophrya sp. A120]|eukprot:GSA120T00019568001.1